MLRKMLTTIPIALLLLVLVVIPTQAVAQSGSQLPIQSSNYCQSCHSSGDERLEDATAWVGGVDRIQVSPCPAVSEIHEQLYYTERLMLAIERAREQVPSSANLSKSDSRLAESKQGYSRLLDTPVTSLEAFSSEAKMVRFQLGKSYSSVSQAIESAKQARVLWVAVGASIFIIASLAWGWFNARKALGDSQNTIQKGFGFYFSRGMVLLLIFVFFSLPIFRLPSQEVETPSVVEQERQADLDETGRAALTADRELSRAWVLAQIAKKWMQMNPVQGLEVLDEALRAAQDAQISTAALWGLSQKAWEAGGVGYNTKAKADLVASDLAAVRGRAWAFRLIAETWMDIDKEKAGTILEMALDQTEAAPYFYAQLDLRSISVVWAQLDPGKGAAIARRITDPALQSWAFREIGALTGEEAFMDAAIEAARLVDEPTEKARALREIGITTGDTRFFTEAAGILQQVNGTALAYALADLAKASGDAYLADQISQEYPAARAYAYYSLGNYHQAWEAASGIADPYEKARAQSAIAASWGDVGTAEQISNSLLRDRALRDISLKAGDPSLVEYMQDSYYQVQLLIAAGQFEDAWKIAENLGDPYPLVAMGAALAADDPQAAEKVLDVLDRESDKAIVLRAIASATGKPDDFERALGMALAARIRGDALSPVQASLELGEVNIINDPQFEAALAQALDAARKINIKY